MTTPLLHEIHSVTATEDPDRFVLSVDMTDMNGNRYVTDYVSIPGDTFGLAPAVRSALGGWLAAGRPVVPYTPPTAEELRALMPSLSPRQIRLALASVDIHEADVDAALAGDPVGMIEWKHSTQFERLHPLIDSLGLVFSISPEEIDSLWTWAKDL